MRAMSCALIIIGAIATVSCDERNDADLPQIVYSLKKNIVTPGVALYVEADGDLLGVAASSAGTYVYNISNVADPTEVFHYEPSGQLYTQFVGVDAVNGLVLTVTGPDAAPGDKYPIHRLADSVRIGGAAFSGGIQEVSISSTENEFNAWRTDQSDGDGLGVSSYCYIADSARWRPDYCATLYNSFIPENLVRLRGFDGRGDLFAVAQNDYNVRIFNAVDGTTTAIFSTLGDPQDCAWYGEYLLVADNFHLTVVNVTDIAHPSIATTLTIPGADRLQRIVVDGHYAVLLDDADGLYIVDVTAPTEPKLVQSIVLPEVSSITTTNGKIIASDEQLGVLIYQR